MNLTQNVGPANVKPLKVPMNNHRKLLSILLLMHLIYIEDWYVDLSALRLQDLILIMLLSCPMLSKFMQHPISDHILVQCK